MDDVIYKATYLASLVENGLQCKLIRSTDVKGGGESETYWRRVVGAYDTLTVTGAIFGITHESHATAFMSALCAG